MGDLVVEYVGLAVIIFAASFVGGMGMTLPRLARDVWRHGFDNHFCNVKGCCR